MDCTVKSWSSWAFALCLGALFVGCRDQGGTPVNRNDSGVTIRTCTTSSECNGEGVCVAGVCTQVTNCDDDTECSADGKICHQSRKFCVECDGRAGQCGAGKTCQFDFTCVDIASNPDAGPADAAACTGTCTDRTQCANDLVCKVGACCPPPSRCRSPEDCPTDRPECNGATGQCFGGGAGCFNDPDCESRPGCAGGACTCDIQGAPPGVCRARPDECQADQDCWTGGTFNQKYCLISSSPKTCQNTVACTGDTQCAALGLVCDTQAGSPSNGYCINGVPCPLGTECTPTQICETGRCVSKNCINTPSLCAINEICNTTTLTCQPAGGCASDTECQAGYYCNLTSNPGTCAPGCRDAADCPGGVCNAAHTCEFATGGLCGSCATDAECPAGATCRELVTSPGTKKCYESCNAITGQDCVLNPAAACIILICSCL